MELSGKKVTVGVTGGIAAYKTAYLVRLLVKAGAEVQVIMTEAATKFVTPLTFEALTDRPVAVAMFPEDRFVSTRHIDFAEWPDLFVIAPASADFIAQVANGFCYSLLACVLCATKRKILLAPAMNEGMYTNPAVQKNLQTLRDLGYLFAEVGVGEMACKSYGPGRMAEPDDIFALVKRELAVAGPLRGKKVLVTAGPCREALDPVRFLSNRSSGKMGFALAEAARDAGGEVTLVTGPVALPDPTGIRTVRVETTEQMAEAVSSSFGDADYLIMAAAPADYRPKIAFVQKIKKCDVGMSVDFVPTADILLALKEKRRSGQCLVGFSLETENELENAKKKLADKNLDFIIVNNPLQDGAGFDVDTNSVTILNRSGHIHKLSTEDKSIIARKIWEFILSSTDE
jgi:phosphopantothenoylcysteine decarboxylase/phosphopantothenate--cysteine ligase